MKPRMQYRSRRVQSVLFEPDHASMIVRNRQGRHYLIHGDDTRLITGFGDPPGRARHHGLRHLP